MSTAGAVPVKNEKGHLSMEKVKVSRYVSGRVPDYAADGSSSSEEDDGFIEKIVPPPEISEITIDNERDRRLMRLRNREAPSAQRSKVREREYQEEDKDESDDDENVELRHQRNLERLRDREQSPVDVPQIDDDEEGGQESDDESEESSSEESESELSAEDDVVPLLKPVFVRKEDRRSLNEIKDEKPDEDAKRRNAELYKEALRIIQQENKREMSEQEKEAEEGLEASMRACPDDDDPEEIGYELWKVRELKRLKRNKEEEEARIKEAMEVGRLRNMTDEQREAEFKKNPKQVTNAAPKGKYRFMQKYYHRGVFFLDKEDEVFKRDFAQPTLEDHFDKTVLPKIMQVRNFGRSGRTKYTHLVDQDTTAFDSPWSAENAQSSKFLNSKAGGMKQVFERPTKRPRK
ncbi:microfibril-associated protein 1 [Brevipalpus obovatus]|uniref:microfibril-associated protein 1 n=1 Tax=Brevipalpus obovatus TaxID=246614 RepID=UPI003D9E3D2B